MAHKGAGVNKANIENLRARHFPMGLLSDLLQVSFRNHDGEEEHTHHVQDEAILVIEGKATYNLPGKTIELGEYGSEAFYARVFVGTEHKLRVDGIAKVCQQGPETFYRTQLGKFKEWGEAKPVDPCRMIRVSEEAFYTSDEVVVVGKSHIEALKAELPNRRSIRLCTHRNVNDRLQEMFVLYEARTDRKKHIAKDSALHVLEGECDFVFYSDAGDVTEIIPLGPKDSGRCFYLRVPAGRYHAVIPTKGPMVVHEATSGPYVREHTVRWA